MTTVTGYTTRKLCDDQSLASPVGGRSITGGFLPAMLDLRFQDWWWTCHEKLELPICLCNSPSERLLLSSKSIAGL